MSTINSKFDDISKIRFEPLTSAVVSVVRMTKSNNIVVALGTDGVVYTNGVSARCCYSPYHQGKLESVLDGCVRLRILTARAVDQHKAAAKARAEKESNEWTAKSFIENAKDLGLKLTAAQSAKLAAYLPPVRGT